MKFLREPMLPLLVFIFLVAYSVFSPIAPAYAELQITELMINPIGDDDDVWEWFEVRNTGPGDIDLSGYLVNKLGFDQGDAAEIPVSGETLVPAGGIVVFYDGPAGGADDELFRTAWSVGPATKLIAFPDLPALSNSGDNRNLGFWASDAAYMSDWVEDGEGGFIVAAYDNAAMSIDYALDGFPGVSSGVSNTWNGAGDFREGANWNQSELGVGGAVESGPAVRPAVPINSTDDVGSPGDVPLFAAPAPGLLITEIMYNPASDDDAWEWIEIYNNTGADVNFDATPYVLDDVAGGNLAEANVSQGAIENGQAAVLFDIDAITLQNMQDAWDPGGLNGTNFIGVTGWSALNNGGDEFGIWDDFNDYLTDSGGEDRVMENAVASIEYDDATTDGEPTDWPADDGDGSIYLVDLSADPSNGLSWDISLLGLSGFAAAEALDSFQVHPGGEIGSPGVFGDAPPTAPADFNSDLLVDAADLALWSASFGGPATSETGDATGDGRASGDDFLAWQQQYRPAGAIVAVPEPQGINALLFVSALAAGMLYVRHGWALSAALRSV